MYIDKLLVFLVENVFSKLYAHASMLTEARSVGLAENLNLQTWSAL